MTAESSTLATLKETTIRKREGEKKSACVWVKESELKEEMLLFLFCVTSQWFADRQSYKTHILTVRALLTDLKGMCVLTMFNKQPLILQIQIL